MLEVQSCYDNDGQIVSISGRQDSTIYKIFMKASETNSYVIPLMSWYDFLVSLVSCRFFMENIKPGRNLEI